MTGRRAFTMTEVVVAAGLMALFLAGLFALYSGGQTASGTAFWMQKTATALRNVARHLSNKVQQSSYPTTLVYPAKIVENSSPDFCLRVNAAGLLSATDSVAVADKTQVGTKFLWFTEALPERRGFDPEVTASLTYHVYSLTRAGKVMYHRFQEGIPFTNAGGPPPAPEFIQNVPRPTIPPPFAELQESAELVEDVEFVRVGIQDTTATGTPVLVEIGCKYPRGHTRRANTTTIVPNVAAVTAAP